MSTYLAGQGCNIADASQFDDVATGHFFARVSFRAETGVPPDNLRDGFASVAEEFGMTWAIHDGAQPMRVLLMVSNFGHCLNDLLYRWRIGALPANIVGVASNHMTYQKLVVNHDLPFHHIRVAPQAKAEAESRLIHLVEENGAELVVLARYMQILSAAFCEKMSGRIINIHHSFLPSFKGANPYKQAFERGVKLIGATAHYVTADLDEGPIIEQDTVRVTHAQSPDDYVSLGRDVEAQVLARAIHAHIHHRVFMNGNKTVVFPASPGGYASERMGCAYSRPAHRRKVGRPPRSHSEPSRRCRRWSPLDLPPEAHGLQIVAVKIEHESGVIIWAVLVSPLSFDTLPGDLWASYRIDE